MEAVLGSSVVECGLYLFCVCSVHQGLQTGVYSPFPSYSTGITDPGLLPMH